MKKMNNYDINEQFLSEAWDKMQHQLDRELPVQKPWYLNKIWSVVGLAVAILLFTGYQCFKFKNLDSAIANTTLHSQDIDNTITAAGEAKNIEKALTEISTNKNHINNISTQEEDLTTTKIRSENNIATVKDNESNSLTKAVTKSFNNVIPQKVNKIAEIELTESQLTKSNVSERATKYEIAAAAKNWDKPATSINLKETLVTKSNAIESSNSASNINLIASKNTVNKNETALNSNLIEGKETSSSASNINNKEIIAIDNTINFLPMVTAELSNEAPNYELTTLLNDTPISKIWQTKKAFTFGFTVGLNTNLKDASGVRAGLFANYNFSNKFMLIGSVAYNYEAINTKYEVRYNVPIDPSEIVIIEQDPSFNDVTQRAIVDEINYNNNYKGVSAKLMLSYFPIKSLGMAGGLFGKRYILSNTTFDFLDANEAYTFRALATNYGYNKFKAGPAFELQYWVKPKLNIAATFEMNLIPEIKQEFWAAAKQNYLKNNFGVALQYQFN